MNDPASRPAIVPWARKRLWFLDKVLIFFGGVRMSRYTWRSPSFRPQLEWLESRELPSAISSQTVALGKAYATLQAEVQVLVNIPASPGGVIPADVAQSDTMKINSDLNSLQADYTNLKNSTKSTEAFLLLGLFASMGNTQEEALYLVGLGAVGKASQQLNSIPGQVSALGNQSLPNTNPTLTVNGDMNLFGFPSLKIS
jgi:hypothetical protein